MTVLSPETQTTLREVSAQTLQQLSEQAQATAAPSWIDPSCCVLHCPAELLGDEEDVKKHRKRSPQCLFFDHAGFLKLEGFVDGATCQRMKEEMAVLTETEWFPERDGLESFGTGTTQNLKRGDYFLESSDQIHYFAEPGALEEGASGTHEGGILLSVFEV